MTSSDLKLSAVFIVGICSWYSALQEAWNSQLLWAMRHITPYPFPGSAESRDAVQFAWFVVTRSVCVLSLAGFGTTLILAGPRLVRRFCRTDDQAAMEGTPGMVKVTLAEVLALIIPFYGLILVVRHLPMLVMAFVEMPHARPQAIQALEIEVINLLFAAGLIRFAPRITRAIFRSPLIPPAVP